MKVGDLVQKKAGNLDKGEVGVIVEVITNDVGNTFAKVSTDNKIKVWYAEFIEVINGNR